MSHPYLIVCSIGNHGAGYNNTRHNAGHYVNNKLRTYFDGKQWSRNSKLSKCVISEVSSYPILLYKSESMMNDSGISVGKNWPVLRREKLMDDFDPVIMVVLHDELSLPVGKCKVRFQDSSPRGHNGLKSILNNHGPKFLSIAIGIGKPEDSKQNGNYVLGKFSLQELQALDQLVDLVISYLKEMIDGKYINQTN